MTPIIHTTGPWTAICHFAPVKDKPGEIQSYWWISANGDNGWKDGRYMSVGGCIDEGDARMICAAPEMLEALKDVVEQCRHYFNAQGRSSHLNLDMQEAAIALAEGRNLGQERS